MGLQDVGIEVDDVGSTVRFLTRVVHLHQYNFSVSAHNPNVAFVLGSASMQKIVALGSFMDRKVSSYAQVNTFLSAHSHVQSYC